MEPELPIIPDGITSSVTQVTSAFDTLIQLSPPIALALFINFMMLFLRRVPYFKSHDDWMIPISALVAGTFIFPHVAEVGKISYNVSSPGLFLHIIGFCIGGLSVAFHQLFKTAMKKFFKVPTGDTMIFEKPAE